jgi:endonuclease VIII
VPEGDTVFLTASTLRQALRGQRLIETDFRLPRLATADLTGQVVADVVARGKHLFLRTDAGLSLHSHLRMQGEWHVYRPGQRWRVPGHEVRVLLRTEPWVGLGVRLPVCELLPTGEEHRVVGHLGPDPLGTDWDAAEVVRRLRQDLERPIGEAVLDQRVMAGPGNVYKSEICFLRGLSPWTPVGEIEDPDGFVELLARLLRANRATGRQITTGDPRPGRDRWVTERAGLPCRRCGTPIRTARQASYGQERPTYWCPSCQPGPVPQA